MGSPRDCRSSRPFRPERRAKPPIGCPGDVRGVPARRRSLARLGFRPRDFEILAAPPAAHAARPPRERLSLTAARADGVANVAAVGEAHGVARPGDYGPPAGRAPPEPPEPGPGVQQGGPPPPHP